MLLLAPGVTRLTLERPSTDTLTIEAERGWLGSPFDNVYRSPARPFPDDYRVELSDVRIQVEELTRDGRPRKVRFMFERSLENASLRWVRYQDGRNVSFELPEVGGERVIEAVPFDLFSPQS